MRAFLDRLLGLYQFELCELPGACTLISRKEMGIVLEALVARDVLEWHASARVDEREAWADWCDYYPTDGESRDELLQWMQADVESFVQRAATSAVRVSGPMSDERTIREWQRDQSWERLTISADTE
jgi:hypothetical protein